MTQAPCDSATAPEGCKRRLRPACASCSGVALTVRRLYGSTSSQLAGSGSPGTTSSSGTGGPAASGTWRSHSGMRSTELESSGWRTPAVGSTVADGLQLDAKYSAALIR